MDKKILVIDDEPDICKLIKFFLDQKGFQTWTTVDPIEGLKILEKEHPDLVLLDILLPKIHGLDCLEQIKSKAPQTVVVILSGVQDEKVARKAILRGAYDYITKPFDWGHFESQVLMRVFPGYSR